MSSEMTMEPSEELASGNDAAPQAVHRHSAVICFLCLWLVCSLCLCVRLVCPPPAELMRGGISLVDIHARFDFPFFAGDGQAQICTQEERLAQAGEAVADDARLKAYLEALGRRTQDAIAVFDMDWGRFIHSSLMLGLVLLCFVCCVRCLRPTFFRHGSQLFLSLVLILLHLGLAIGCYFLLLWLGIESTLHFLTFVPLFLVPGLAVMLLGDRVSVCLAILLSLLTSMLFADSFQFMLFQYSLLCSLVSIAVYRGVDTYGGLLVRGLVVFLAVVVLDVLTIWHYDFSWVFRDLADFWGCLRGLSFWQTHVWSSIGGELTLSLYWQRILLLGFVNGLFTTLALLFLPRLLECFFAVVSPLRLRQLCSSEHPLLRQLQKEARGTYEHCMEVGEMAALAANAIGANEMLAKVCGYFHDVGKLQDAKCFAENAYAGESPHLHFTPEESSRRICAHVLHGVELGRRHHLPGPVIEAIYTHHGNDLVGYFYRKACQTAEQAGLAWPEEKNFRYQAPLPHHKEVVIVEIADICEAAGRAELSRIPSLDRQQVKNFVLKLIASKFEHRQFADADMTLAELTTVCDVMEECLRARYHERPTYGTVVPAALEMNKTTSFVVEERAAATTASTVQFSSSASATTAAAVLSTENLQEPEAAETSEVEKA